MYFCITMKRKESVFTEKIVEWYVLNGRDLPWRRTSDPYIIWISEIILQQTRVAQGLEYFLRFTARFPDVFSLANAPEDEVMRYWQGLGYYSRARNLHEAARTIAEKGEFPKDYPSVLKLKGVGEYTAAAICSIAYGLPHAVVDGNVYRVLSRYFCIDTPIDSTQGKKDFNWLANEMLDHQNPGRYNQAIMDFGATVCTPKSPACESCPLNETCMAYHSHRMGELPVKSHKTKVTDRYFTYVLVRMGDSFLLHQRTGKDIWQNLYEFPLIETTDGLLSDSQLVNTSEWQDIMRLFQEVKAEPHWQSLCEETTHVLSHRKIHARFVAVQADSAVLPLAPEGFLWVKRQDLHQYAVSRLVSVLFDIFFQIND